MSRTKQTEDKGKCRCGACGESFRRLEGFDKHRYGPWTDRRFLTLTGMVERGFATDSHGRWIAPRRASRGDPRVFPKTVQA